MNDKREQRYKNWQGLIEKQGKSGQSQRAFCEEHKLSDSKMSYYRSVLKCQEPHALKPPPGLTPISLKRADSLQEQTPIKITLPNGFQCEIPLSSGVSTIKNLMEVLLSC